MEKSESSAILKSQVNSEGAKNENNLKRWKFAVGVSATVVSCIASLAGIACVQLMDQIPPDFELNALRFIVGLVLSVFLLLFKKLSPKVRKGNIKWIIAIGIIIIIYNIALYSHNLKLIPIVTVLCIHGALKIILSLILSRIFLTEPISLVKCGVCLLAFIGSTCTVVPRVAIYFDWGIDVKKVTPNDSTVPITTSAFNYLALNSTSKFGEEIQVFTLDSTDSKSNHEQTSINDFMIAVLFIFCASLTTTIQSLVLAGSPLKDVSVEVLSFWYFLFGTIISVSTTFVLEHPFIPKFSDILLCFGHSFGAFGSTFFDMISLQNIDVNTIVIITTIRIPMALVASMTFLRDIIPVKQVYLLIIGTIITTLTTIILPVYEYWSLQKSL